MQICRVTCQINTSASHYGHAKVQFRLLKAAVFVFREERQILLKKLYFVGEKLKIWQHVLLGVNVEQTHLSAANKIFQCYSNENSKFQNGETHWHTQMFLTRVNKHTRR